MPTCCAVNAPRARHPVSRPKTSIVRVNWPCAHPGRRLLVRTDVRTMTRTYVALDLETTGLDPEQDRIIEIGAVRFDASGRELEAYQQLINPGREIPPFIERFT